jgi:hypothetical protein
LSLEVLSFLKFLQSVNLIPIAHDVVGVKDRAGEVVRDFLSDR